MRHISFFLAAIVGAVAVALSATPVSAVPAEGQQRDRVVISPDYVIVSGGLQGLFSHCKLAVIGKIDGSPRTRKREMFAGTRDGAPRIVHPEVEHAFTVVQVFKNATDVSLAKGDKISVDQEAGEVEDEGRIIEIDRNRVDLLRPGATYILFLVPSTAKNHYVPMTGPQSCILLSAGKPVPLHPSVTVPGSVDELVATLKELGKGGK
jgi:hypothetical protein